MALLDMIKESLADPEVDAAVENEQFQDIKEDKEALESFGMDFNPTEKDYERIPVDANDALAAVEAHLGMLADDESAEEHYPSQLAKAIEESLPSEAPAYDPTEELDDIANVLAGIDSDDDVDPDQPQPEEDINNDSTINDMMTEPKDNVKIEDPDANGILNV